MTDLLPTALTTVSDTVAVDATYFLVRILRNVLRGYEGVAVSPESSAEAAEVVARALLEIERNEGTPVTELSPERLRAYMEVLNIASSRFFASAVGGSDSSRGEKVLADMDAALRSSRGTDG